MGKLEEANLAEILRWWHPPNPPDPAHRLDIRDILEKYADKAQQQQIVAGLVKLQVATLQAETQFWTDTQRVIGAQVKG